MAFISMFEGAGTHAHEYPCLNHRKEKVTHICTDFRCTSNPFLCGCCIAEGGNRAQHGGHE